MEIGIVASRYPIGPKHDAGRAVHSFAHGLAALGHTVTVYTYNSTNITTKEWKTKNLKVVSVGVLATMPIKAGLIYEDADNWNLGVWDELENQDTTKVLLVFDWFGFVAACKHRSEYGSLVVGVVSSALANGRGHFVPFTDAVKLLDFKTKELEFLNHSDYLIAFNKCSDSEIGKLTATPHSVVHLGVEESIDTTRSRATEQSGSVLVVGRISREKVLEAFLRAIIKNYWIELTLCGTGKTTDYGQYITKVIAKWEIGNRVKIVEGTPESCYAQAEMVVCPSIYDPFSYQVYDAFNYGVPVIANYASYSDVIKHSDTGYLYQSVDELSKAMNQLHSSRILRKQLALSGKAEMTEQYTKQRSIERVDHLLLQITDGVYAE